RVIMNRFAVTGSLLAFALGGIISGSNACGPRADDKEALKHLQGHYIVIALSKDGKDAPEDFRKEMTLTITGDELTFTIKDKAFPEKITKIDPKAKLPMIDIAPSDGPEKGKTFPGVYTYKDGELTLAFTEKGERPKDFTGEGDATVMKLKKV